MRCARCGSEKPGWKEFLWRLRRGTEANRCPAACGSVIFRFIEILPAICGAEVGIENTTLTAGPDSDGGLEGEWPDWRPLRSTLSTGSTNVPKAWPFAESAVVGGETRFPSSSAARGELAQMNHALELARHGHGQICRGRR